MAGIEVEAVRTPTTVEEARDRFIRAWGTRFGESPSPEILALLLALWDLETAQGKSMYHWNHGNQVIHRDDMNYFMLREAGNHRYRIYATPDEGALSFVSQVTSTTRPQWETGLRTGDPVAFAHALGGRNGGPQYYEADVDRYTKTLVGRWQRYAPANIPVDAGEPAVAGIPNIQPNGTNATLIAVGLLVTAAVVAATELISKKQ